MVIIISGRSNHIVEYIVVFPNSFWLSIINNVSSTQLRRGGSICHAISERKQTSDLFKQIKGAPKKLSIFKIWYAIFSWTVGPKRVSFSGLWVLMSTPSPDKDTLFGPTVHKKIAYQILKMEFFFGTPFNSRTT